MRKREPKITPTGQPCAVAGCPNPGDYKAPVSRWQTDAHQYLCLEHVREFNQAWDYFAGWSSRKIEEFRDGIAHGHRPTWSMSNRVGGAHPLFTDDALRESFFRMMGEEAPKREKPGPRVKRREREAFAVMDIEPGADLAALKAQYKKLVKKYHPDVNKGDKLSEETFKRITAAYTLLCKTYESEHEE